MERAIASRSDHVDGWLWMPSTGCTSVQTVHLTCSKHPEASRNSQVVQNFVYAGGGGFIASSGRERHSGRRFRPRGAGRFVGPLEGFGSILGGVDTPDARSARSCSPNKTLASTRKYLVGSQRNRALCVEGGARDCIEIGPR